MEKLEFPFKYNMYLCMYNVFVYLLFCSWFFYGEGDQTVTKIAQNSLEVSIIEDIPDPVEHSPEQPDVADPT